MGQITLVPVAVACYTGRAKALAPFTFYRASASLGLAQVVRHPGRRMIPQNRAKVTTHPGAALIGVQPLYSSVRAKSRSATCA
jgi:hypothetical protein